MVLSNQICYSELSLELASQVGENTRLLLTRLQGYYVGWKAAVVDETVREFK